MINLISWIINYFEKPVKFDLLDKWISKNHVKILDVGCGNHSASKTKKYYPNCIYYGLDRDKNYNNDVADFKAMEKFYEVDISRNSNKLEVLPNNFFDCIILSHVIEHLINGQDIILHLLSKLKKGGVIYIEFPSQRSLYLPSMKGTLNFYDDLTHKKTYQIKEIERLLKSKSFSIVKSGTRRSPKRILFLSIYLLGSLINLGYISGHVFWDILGFANYIIAQKIGKFYRERTVEKFNLKKMGKEYQKMHNGLLRS